MRILQLISYFAPAWAYGGSVRAVYEISKELVKRGHQVTVCTTDVCDEYRRVKIKKQPAVMDGVKVFYFPTISNWLSWHFRGFVTPSMYPFLDREIKKFDIVHLHECYTFQSIITHQICQKHKIPYIFSGHGSIVPLPERERLLIKKLYLNLWGEKLVRDASRLIALTSKEKEQYLTFGVDPTKVTVIPNGIDLNAFAKLPVKGSFRQRYHLSSEDRVILFLGRVYKLKGLENLISAFSELNTKLSNVHLVIAGPSVDNYQKLLESLVESLKLREKIIFTGFVGGQEKLSILVDADLLVLPSYDDVFGIVILEAMAVGLPVIATEGVGLSGIIDDISGLKVENNSRSLATGILKILNNRKLREKFSREGAKLVEDFDQRIIVDKIETLYQKIIS